MKHCLEFGRLSHSASYRHEFTAESRSATGDAVEYLGTYLGTAIQGTYVPNN